MPLGWVNTETLEDQHRVMTKLHELGVMAATVKDTYYDLKAFNLIVNPGARISQKALLALLIFTSAIWINNAIVKYIIENEGLRKWLI